MVRNTGDPNDKRSFSSTLFDPKLLQILIPVILAVGSAFIMHDRTIVALQHNVQGHVTQYNEVRSDIKDLMSITKQNASSIAQITANVGGVQSRQGTIAEHDGRMQSQIDHMINQLDTIREVSDEVHRLEHLIYERLYPMQPKAYAPNKPSTQ